VGIRLYVEFVINFKSPTHQVILLYAFSFASIIFVLNASVALLISTLEGFFLAKSKWMILEFKVRKGKLLNHQKVVKLS
jgi:hypothetical protein